MTGTSQGAPHARVPRAPLATELQALAGLLRGGGRGGDAVLAWDDGALVIEVAGQRGGVAASGTWPGVVRVPAVVLLRFATWLPEDDPVEVRVADGRLHLGRLSVRCVWVPDAPRPIEVPLDPPLTLVLGLAHAYTPEEIVRSGHARLLRAAQDRRDRLVRKAAAVLAPLGVGEDDLLDVVDALVAASHARQGPR